MTTIGFIRHGSTEWNQLGKLQGQLDTDLTQEGRDQASLLGMRLAHESWSGVLSSDLMRARETGLIISELADIPFLGTDSRLRERRYGQAEGTTSAEREERWGADWKKRDLGQETDEELFARWTALEEELIEKYPNERLLLVSHGGFIAQVLNGFQIETSDFLQNTSLTILLRNEHSWELQLYNCLKHLNV